MYQLTKFRFRHVSNEHVFLALQPTFIGYFQIDLTVYFTAFLGKK